MALLKVITGPAGFDASYWAFSMLSIDLKRPEESRVTLAGYKDEAAFRAGANPVHRQALTMNAARVNAYMAAFRAGNDTPLQTAYDLVKSALPAFAGATDAPD